VLKSNKLLEGLPTNVPTTPWVEAEAEIPEEEKRKE
jgi:hypothetical protein